jgi:Protein of unknown function (DUF504).
MPIDVLLNRIQWDRDFGWAEFSIGYEDRVAAAILVVPLHQVVRIPGDRFSVRIVDGEGVWHRVPLHRIKQVYRNGELIWQRPRCRLFPGA